MHKLAEFEGCKPTYEGLKMLRGGRMPANCSSCKPTYEGLKKHRKTAVSPRPEGLQAYL